MSAAALAACATSPKTDAQAPELEITPIAGFPHAKLYRLPGAKLRPVIVILAGAEGNDDAGRRWFGPVLARAGYAAVSLPYYSPNWGSYAPPPKLPELPGSVIDIRVDQLAELREALRPIAGVDVKRLALFGGSLGAEFALIAASRYDWITSVVAFVPSDLVWEGWGLETVDAPGTRSSFSFEGKPLAFMPYKDFYEVMNDGPAPSMRPPHDKGRAAHPEKETAARIPIENYKGEVMLIAGDKDQMWDSYGMSRNIVVTRNAAGLRTEALLYPEAGHDLGGGSSELQEDKRGGGTAAANAAARVDAWPKVLAFLKRTLKP